MLRTACDDFLGPFDPQELGCESSEDWQTPSEVNQTMVEGEVVEVLVGSGEESNAVFWLEVERRE